MEKKMIADSAEGKPGLVLSCKPRLHPPPPTPHSVLARLPCGTALTSGRMQGDCLSLIESVSFQMTEICLIAADVSRRQ